jgi:hypothetical protein
MRFTPSIAVFALAFATPALAQTRLTDQSVLGWKRICSYEDLRPAPAGARGRRGYVMQIGRGEPCPPRYTAPAPDRPNRRPAQRPVRPTGLSAPQN